MLKLNVGIEMYGIRLYEDSATIKRKPFLYILAASGKEPSIVLEIADVSDHLSKGKKKTPVLQNASFPGVPNSTLTTNYLIVCFLTVRVMHKRQAIF
jgi:hypothetical protein